MEHVLIPLTTGAVVTGEVVFDEPLPSGARGEYHADLTRTLAT